MLKRYIARRQNPWELLAIGALYFVPGLVLFLHRGPAVFLNARWISMRPSVMSQGQAHVFGACGIFVGVACVALYLYVRRTSERLTERQSSPGTPHPGETPLAYGSTRSPIPIFERLKFWRSGRE